ncbi:hypothetical protein [Lacisediminihabitans sp. H27-G8]|uniref:hypothetical protein n=1 Tax=Lacisediminihabitans sp. H27-G8 TaxID=3111909 RepID=UPI0038FCC759
MRRNHPLPPVLASRPFTVEEAARLGVGAGRLRGSDLRRPFHGIRMPRRLPDGVADLAAAYATRMPAVQYFSHWTAAALLALRLPEAAVPKLLDVSVPSPRRAPRTRGVRGHEQLSSVRTRLLPNGLRVSDPVETWCHLAAELSVDELIVMGDGLVCRQSPFATLADLAAAVEEWGARRGAHNLRRALPEIRCRTDSARETVLRLLIVRAGLPEPAVNVVICNSFGVVIGLGDLAYPRYRVLLEYDGGQHRSDEGQFHTDIARLDAFMEERWRVIRVNKSLMQQRATLLGKVRTALEAAGWTA